MKSRLLVPVIAVMALASGCGPIKAGDAFSWHGQIYHVLGAPPAYMKFYCASETIIYNGTQYDVCLVKGLSPNRGIVVHTGLNTYLMAGTGDH